MRDVSADALRLIFAQLPVSTLGRCRTVCRRWNDVMTDEFHRELAICAGFQPSEKPDAKSWLWCFLSKNPAGKRIGRIQKSNAIYEGDIRERRADGVGFKREYVNGRLYIEYVGDWRAGKRDGRGIERTSHASYEGQWKEGKKHGWGSWRFFSPHGGESAEGIFVRGVISYGTYIWNDGRRYVGQMKTGAEGYGQHFFPDGSVYVGEWCDMQRSGRGKMVWADGKSWDGEWLRDERMDDDGVTPLARAKWDGFYLLPDDERRRIAKEEQKLGSLKK